VLSRTERILVRILIVEDDPIVAMTAAAVLEDAGHDVVGPAYDAEDAWRLARTASPQLAFVDINLAGHDEGLALARRFKDRLGLDSIYVSGQINAARASRSAALGLLTKPYDPLHLVAAVAVAREIMAGRSPLPPQVPPALEIFLH
jgi:CheY-like chemotaxis protein